MRKAISILWSVLLTFCIMLSVIAIAIEYCTYDDSFFEKQYLSYNAAQNIKTDLPSLMLVTDTLQDYLKGSKPNLDIELERNGETVQFFNDREKDHMVDVLVLFNFARVTKYICLAILLGYCVLSAFLKKTPFSKHFCKAYIFTVSIIIGIGACLALLISLNFNAAWTFAHTLVFSNDLWLLDPQTDMLINLVPLEFFIAITSKIAVIIVGALAIVYAACVLCLCKAKARAQKEVRDELSKSN